MIEFIRNLIFRDFWLKLLSLVFAVFIWLSVSKVFLDRDVSSPLAAFGSHTAERTYHNVPVMVVFPAADIRAVLVDPSEIRVTVRGEPEAIDKMKPSDVHAQVDLTGIESARALRKRVEVTVPSGITPVRIFPDEVEVIIPPK